MVWRLATALALGAVVALIVLQVGGGGDLGERVDGTTLGLLVVALLLLAVLASPETVQGVVRRIETVKLPGGFEFGVQAAGRAERIQSQGIEFPDDVTVPPRPRTGTPEAQYQAVREKLSERLSFVRNTIFGWPSKLDDRQIVTLLETEGLLRPDELELVNDVLGRIEDALPTLPATVRAEYLDTTWKFCWRFGSLVFERLVRLRLTKGGWMLLDFAQARGHRPDFLAYRDQVWLLVAARVEPGKAGPTRRRLSKHRPPFEAKSIVVIPDSRSFKPDDEHPGVDVVQLSALLEREP